MSALKENEIWLDSIGGKVSQFNNAMQAMWSDTLNSDVVKGFVELATQLAKIVDAIGPLNIALVGFFTYLEKKHGVLSNFFKPAEDGVEALKQQLAKAEDDLAKATRADTQHGNKKTAQNRRDAEERVAILKSKIQESSSEAILDGIDESFDPGKVKKSIGGKKGAITKRAKKLEGEGMSFAQIQEDPKIQQWTQEIKEGEQALNDYNAKVAQADAALKQKNATTTQAAGAERAKAGAEAADAAATNAGANADRMATTEENKKTAATWADVWATLTNKDASLADVAAKIKQILLTKILSTEYVKQAIANGTLTAAQIANMTATQLLALGFKGLALSIASATAKMWAFMTTTPIGLILLAVGAVVALGAAFSAIHKTTEELNEELDGLKSELSDIRSELESVNSELETANERMAELLAKDSLTFAEQEELDRLKEITAQLERQKGLLENKEEYQAGRVGRMAARTVNSAKSEKDWWEQIPVLRLFTRQTTAEEDVKRKIENYAGWKKQSDNAPFFLQDTAQQQLDDTAAQIDEYIATLSETLEGVEYGDSAESDAALDYLAELEDSYAIARGAAGAKTNAIKGIFNKDEFAGELAAIDEYVKALKDGDINATESIANIIKNNEELVHDLEVRGLEAQDAVDYFTKLGENLRFDTPEGKEQEITRAKNAMQSLMDGFNSGSIDVNTLFDEDGKIIQTKLSEMFKGTSEKTRAELTKLLESSYNQIADGLNDGEMESLIQRFGIKMELALLDVKNAALAEQNIELFPGLKEEIDGIIDSFSEMSSALNSVVDAMDLLEQARAEEAYSGSISLETMAKLMEQTDDYSKILSVDEYGAITLVADAEDILIDQRIEKIKTDTQAALAVAQKTHEDAKAAEQDALNAKQTLELSGPSQQWYIKILNTLAGAIAYVGSLWDSITSGNFDGMFDRASEAYNEAATTFRDEKAEAEHAKQLAEANAAYDAAVTNRENSEKELKKAEDNANIASKITKDNIKSSVKSDYADGTKDDERDEAENAFQKAMDYWENRIGANQAKYEQLQNEIDLLEAKGQKADASFYEEQIQLENERMWLLEQQRAEAEMFLGTFAEGSDEWWEVANTLNDIESELDDVTASIVNLQDAIGEIDTYKFEEFNTRLDDITNKLGTIRDLIAPDGEEDWFDDEGQWTEEGIAVLGTYIQELETYKQGLAEAESAYANYVKEYAGNEKYYAKLGIHSEQELYDKRQELIEQQYDYAQSISDTEQFVVDMYESNIDAIEEYTETLIDSYNDYIDSVKEALDAERDLYDFKKNVQKQSKDIAAIERRIASLSGSTNASDVAERRKLEAQLYESRESLNDTYYDHARSAQDEALDAEQVAYEESMNKFVEGLRTSLETATMNMDEFLMGVTSMVMYNADTVLTKYQETNLPLTEELTNPWIKAKEAVGTYSGDALALMNKWTEEGGFFTQFNETGTKNLQSPWTAGSTAAGAFKTSVSTVMEGVVSNISTNVKTASSELSKLYQQILDTEKRAAEAKTVVDFDAPDKVEYNPNPTSDPAPTPTAPKKTSTPVRQSTPTRPKFKKVGDLWSGVGHTGVSIGKKTYNKALEIEGADAIYYPYTNGNGYQGYIRKGEGYTVLSNGKMDIHSLKPIYQKYAQGTTGTDRDEWAITDEPQFGDELVLVPGKDGNLSFMRKGTGVVPADMTQKLFELAQIPTSDLMNKNLTAIVPNITKNDFKNEFHFESLVHVDTVDSDTLPKLEKMVDKKIDDFSKALNYSLKRFAR